MPTGTVAGDLMIAALMSGADGTWSVPSGWSGLGSGNQGNGAGRWRVFWKVKESTTVNSWQFQFSANVYIAGVMATFRNADVTSLQSNGTTTGNGGSSADLGSITVPDATLILGIGAVAHGNGFPGAPVDAGWKPVVGVASGGADNGCGIGLYRLWVVTGLTTKQVFSQGAGVGDTYSGGMRALSVKK